MNSNSINKYSIKTFLYIFLFWLGYGLFEIISSLVYYAESGVGFNWLERFVTRLPVYISWTIFIPFIYNYVLNRRIEKPNILKNVLLICAFGMVIAVIHRIFAVSLVEILKGAFLESRIDLFDVLITKKFFLFAYMFDSFLMYCMIVAVIFTIDYYRKFSENRLKSSELQSKLAQAELNLLKMQIHPHFLFNTLNSISALVHKNPDEADKMISLLSDLLRTTLDNSGKQFVTFRSELEFLDLYIAIQKIRFSNRLKVIKRIDPGSLEVELPGLILQPIVENAIKHVLDKSKDVCEIIISSSLNNHRLNLVIQDNGPGIKDEMNPFLNGIGLKNVKARLGQIYGSGQELIIENLVESGLKIVISIPSKRDIK